MEFYSFSKLFKYQCICAEWQIMIVFATGMTMSMTKPADGRRCRHETAASNSSCVDGSVTSNSLRDTATMLPFQQSRYRDGGAHWYRSSAVMLHYHR